MYDNPTSLQEACVDYICKNIEALNEIESEETRSKFSFKETDIFFPSLVSEKLLSTLCEKGKLTDATLSLFDPTFTRLEHIKLHNAEKISSKGLRILKGHKITELEVTGSNIIVNELIGCLGEWTLQNLHYLNVSNNSFSNSIKFCVVVGLSKLKNLQVLDVSNTDFNTHGLEIVIEDLPLLESLDLSGTLVDDLTSLKKCRHRLKFLNIYNLKHQDFEDTMPVLLEMVSLKYLDISDDKKIEPSSQISAPCKCKIKTLLTSHKKLPNLISLDISGREDIDIEDLRMFIDHHPKLTFLGLVQTDVCHDEMFTDENSTSFQKKILVTGIANEGQLLSALKRYISRPSFIQKSLFHLFPLAQNFTESRSDIIKLILPVMKKYPKEIAIQMAATACLCNLTKGDFVLKIHPSLLSELVCVTLDAMTNFPKNFQLQKNVLLTLCSDRILQYIHFDRYRCAKLVMDCLYVFDDPAMDRMAVAICSILAAKISTAETSKLGSFNPYMKKLLSILAAKTESSNVDITMKFTLSALWNLTDESPITCSTFLKEGGMDLILKILKTFKDDSAIETKVLGLVNNIAEVPHLRSFLMVPDFISTLRSLLHSSQIDVSYFAAGIVAHLASQGDNGWDDMSMKREDLLSELGKVVLSWEMPDNEMVAYRSFHPFFPLLNSHDAPEVQMWAVWAMWHVCIRNSERYCPMIREEGADLLLEKLLEDPKSDAQVKALCNLVLNVDHGNKYHCL